MRFVPFVRNDDVVGYEKLKTLEQHFIKEELTQGFHVIN